MDSLVSPYDLTFVIAYDTVVPVGPHLSTWTGTPAASLQGSAHDQPTQCETHWLWVASDDVTWSLFHLTFSIGYHLGP